MNKSCLSSADIARRYLLGEPLATIATDAGISRIAIWKRLVAAGVPRTRTEAPKPVTCCRCGSKVMRHRHLAMRAMRQFCSSACYRAWIREHGAGYVAHRHGQRVARRVVASYITIPPGAVVHHHDKNDRNNALSNLALFASHADHMSFHRGGKGQPIWDGRTITEVT